MSTNSTFEQKKQFLFLFLCGLFLTNALIAEIIGVKIFSVEALLGTSPAQLPLFGTKLDFNMSAGVVNWPVVFITSDIINEYFGKKGVRRISYLTAIFIAYMYIAIYATTSLPPAQFWLEVNSKDSLGNAMNIDGAFNAIFRQGLGIMIGSIIAFLIGQILDVTIFSWLRRRTGSKHIWLRATGSTLFSQLIDSFVVIFIAFYVFGNWSMTQVAQVGSINYIYKGVVALLMTPILYVAHYLIDQYLGKENAHQMANEAAAASFTAV
ncbi:MAG: queuosine precursor transporter [Runella zeae]